MKEVLILDHPGKDNERMKWMGEFVGKTAEVVEVHTLYRVQVDGEKFWIGEGYVKEISQGSEEESA